MIKYVVIEFVQARQIGVKTSKNSKNNFGDVMGLTEQ